MLAIITVILIVALSILVTRVATVALIHTGMSREAARFQARSAFSGVGFATAEAEQVVSHPVRRRIIMLLMLLSNAGIVTVIGSLILGFTVRAEAAFGFWARLAILAMGVAGLLVLSNSAMVDRWLSVAISKALKRWTNLDIRDYAGLLHLSGEYAVRELRIREGDYLTGRQLSDLQLRDEGLNVLGVERPDGCYVGTPRGSTTFGPGDVLIVYGREAALARLDDRRKGYRSELEHAAAVAEQKRVEAEEEDDHRRRQKDGRRPKQSMGEDAERNGEGTAVSASSDSSPEARRSAE